MTSTFRGLVSRVKRLVRDDSAPTTIEYALMVAGVFLVVIAAVLLLGQAVSGSLDDSTQKIEKGG
jgi:Flp pilus assembly pilin Flp